MAEVKCPECGGRIAFLPGESLEDAYCTSMDCGWTGDPVKQRERKRALDRQVGGDWYKNLAIQPIEYCQKNKLGACESAVIKYVTRYKHKGGEEDIHKAIHLLEMLLVLEYPAVIPDELNRGMT